MESKRSRHGHGRNLVAELPDDMVASILLKLPTGSLLVARRACKSWLRIISDPSFALLYRAQHPPVLGFFTNSLKGFIPARDHQAMLLSDEFKRSCAVRARCNGNLLCETRTTQNYNIYNLATKQRVTWVPPSPSTVPVFDSIGIICNADSSRYKIVKLEKPVIQEDHRCLHVHTYSSETKGWRRTISALTGYCKHAEGIRECEPWGIPVSMGDITCWLCGDSRVLLYDTERSLHHFYITPPMPMPMPGRKRFPPNVDLTCTEGRLRYTTVCRRKLHIWVLSDSDADAADGSAWWFLEHRVSIEKILEGNEPLLQRFQSCDDGFDQIFRPLGFDSVNRHLLFFTMMFGGVFSKKFYSFHLQTTELKELCYVTNPNIR